jgi:hypothetical protein
MMKTSHLRALAITMLGRLEVEPGAGAGRRARARCARGHYITPEGDPAPIDAPPAPMTVDALTRAIVLHRRLCG